jgi:putative endonuclease
MPSTHARKTYFVYIMGSLSGTLYSGVTNSVRRRSGEHKDGMGSEFTARYHVDRLLYFESFQYVGNAIAREKEIKGWRRAKKVALIESTNPTWRDLSRDFGLEFKPEVKGGNAVFGGDRDSSLRSE